MNELSRRRWLKSAAGSLVLGVPSMRAAEVDAPRPLLLGFSLYGMKGLATAEAIKLCADIGYSCIELALLPGWPTEPKRLTAADRRELGGQLADAKLTLAALMENLAEPAGDTVHQANLERLKAAAELGHALSPKAPPIIETVLGGKPADWDKIKDKLVERLRAWAKVGAAARTVIAIKPHVANALHLPAQAKWLMGQVESPWLKLAFDYSHFVLSDLPLDKTIAELAPLSAFVHIKDARGKPEKFEFLLPGEGGLSYADYFKHLHDAGYRGPVVVEVSGQISSRRDYDPVAAARRSYAKLAPALKALK
jgi:sugar phosphate isomerase/epimerase